MAEGEEAMSQEDWREKCMVLEALLMKFRMQIIKIRELTADKVGSSKSHSVNLTLQMCLTWMNRWEGEKRKMLGVSVLVGLLKAGEERPSVSASG